MYYVGCPYFLRGMFEGLSGVINAWLHAVGKNRDVEIEYGSVEIRGAIAAISLEYIEYCP